MRAPLFLFAALSFTCMAASPVVEQQARALQVVLRQADDSYYNKHQSELSDEAYDALRTQYDQLVADYPELAAENPVGAPVESGSRWVAHDVPVLSLEKVYSDDGIRDFLQRCGTNRLYCVEPKLDGLTVVLRYVNGRLAQALTRGDGKTGLDVTPALLASGAVPIVLSNVPARLELRGEALLSFTALEELNRRRAANGEPALKSPRNTASGTLMLKDYAEIARRTLTVQLFDLLAADPMPSTHAEALARLKAAGLPIVESRTVPAAEVLSAIETVNRARNSFPFATDGIVIKVDNLADFAGFGATAHHPRGAIARKYHETPVQTRLLSVEWTQGDTGKLTPIGIFDPVEINGATIQRATLHNAGYIRAMDLKIGDWIQVIRAGGSVPEIIGVILDRRTGSETEIPKPLE